MLLCKIEEQKNPTENNIFEKELDSFILQCSSKWAQSGWSV